MESKTKNSLESKKFKGEKQKSKNSEIYDITCSEDLDKAKRIIKSQKTKQ